MPRAFCLTLLIATLAFAAPAHAQWRPNTTGNLGGIAVDGIDIIRGGGPVYVSRTGGAIDVSSGTAIPFAVAQIAVGDGSFYASTRAVQPSNPASGLYRSSDDGVTWTNVTAGLVAAVGASTFTVEGVGVDGATVYATVDFGFGPSRSRLYRSPDRGTTWAFVSLPPVYSFQRLFRQQGALYMMFTPNDTGAGLYRSTDNGVTWTYVMPPALSRTSATTRPLPVDLYSTSDAASGALYVGARLASTTSPAGPFGHQLYRSLDGGATWTRLYTPLQAPGAPDTAELGRSTVQSVAVVGNTLAVTVLSLVSGFPPETGLWISTDDGRTWGRTVRTNSGQRYASASAMNRGSLVVAVGGLLYTDLGAAAPSAVVDTPDPFALAPAAATDSIRATVSGVRIRAAALLVPSGQNRDSLIVRRNVAGNAPLTGLYDPSGNGSTGPPFPPFPSMMADTWSFTATGGFDPTYFGFSSPVYDFPFDPAGVPNPAALVLLRRVGSGWQRMTGVIVLNGSVRYAQSRSALSGDYTLGSTDPANTFRSVVSAEAASAPLGLALTAFPNPARGAATLRVSLAEAQTARVTLTDVLGREVLAVGHALPAGASFVPLDLSGLAPGVYVARLTASGASATVRLTITR